MMEKIWFGIIAVALVAVSLFSAGCTSVFNPNDLTFLSSLQEFQNESVSRISLINEDVKLKQWYTVKNDLSEYQGVIKTEIDHLNSLQVSEKVIPVREQAVAALKKQDAIIQKVVDLPELNESVIPDLAGDYLSSVIDTAMKSALSGKE
jgi:hypothetical protein